MIMDKLLLTKSKFVIPNPNSKGPSKKFLSFQRYVSNLLTEADLDVTETSSEAILSSVEEITQLKAEEVKKEDDKIPSKNVVFSDDSDLDPEKILNYY